MSTCIYCEKEFNAASKRSRVCPDCKLAQGRARNAKYRASGGNEKRRQKRYANHELSLKREAEYRRNRDLITNELQVVEVLREILPGNEQIVRNTRGLLIRVPVGPYYQIGMVTFRTLFIPMKGRKRTKPPEVDIYLPERQLAIDVRAKQHHVPRPGQEEKFKRCLYFDGIRVKLLHIIKVPVLVLDIYENRYSHSQLRDLLRKFVFASRGSTERT